MLVSPPISLDRVAVGWQYQAISVLPYEISLKFIEWASYTKATGIGSVLILRSLVSGFLC